MKQLLTLILLVTCSLISAQDLYVSTGSYVYVDGAAFTNGPTVAPLYVTDDISLANDGNIYLRNDAQLLQGSAATGNTGEGKLSVYQTGTVNQWSYNYWCSPVGNNSTALGNEDARAALLNDATGLTTAIPAAFTTNVNGSATPLTISNRWLWTYQTSNAYSDWVYAGANGPIGPGLGFTMKGNGTSLVGTDSQLYDFRGKPNNGTIVNPVTDGDFTLVGNPYPSAMDSAAFIHDPANVGEIQGTLFYWEHSISVASHYAADYIGGYHEFSIDAAGTIISAAFATFNTYDGAGNIIGTPGPPIPPTGSKLARRYIPVGQGFMVEGLPGSTQVTTNNSHRVFQKTGTDSYFFRNNSDDNNETATDEISGIQYQDNGLSIIPSDYKRFRLNVDFTINEVQYTRQVLLNFHDDATFGHDRGLELHRSDNLSSDVYFEQDEDIYSGLAYPFTEDLTIPLSIDIELQQPLRFRIFDIQNFDESQSIYIHDIENDTYVNLRDLNYELNIEPGNYTDRFEIVFTAEGSLGIDGFDTTALNIYQNNKRHQLSVLNPNGLDIKSINIYDVAGKRILQSSFNTVEDQYNVSTSRLSDGVYVVNVSSHANTKAKSQKIIVKN